jgi:hypothetical protein
VIVCCVYKRRKESEGDDWTNNSNTGRNIELITDGSRKPYL